MAKDALQGATLEGIDPIIPYISILQASSPQCAERSEAHLEGAAPSRYWLHDAPTNPFRDVLADVLLCGSRQTWTEWLRPRGSGFVERHLVKPTDLESIPRDDGRLRPLMTRASGNELVDTLELYLLVSRDPYVFYCTSTKITFARQWISYTARLRHAEKGTSVPSYGHRFKLTTLLRAKGQYRWAIPVFHDLGEIEDGTAYRLARDFAQFIRSGQQRVAAPDEDA
jgi:hypothetical protein